MKTPSVRPSTAFLTPERERALRPVAIVVLLDFLLLHEFLVSSRGWPLLPLAPALVITASLILRLRETQRAGETEKTL